jgi:hypothetical protein
MLFALLRSVYVSSGGDSDIPTFEPAASVTSAPQTQWRSSTALPSAAQRSNARFIVHPKRYENVPVSEVFQAIPPIIPHNLLHVEFVDVLLPNGSSRCSPGDLPFDFIFNATHPAAFLINLDERADRLRESTRQWMGLVQLVRVSAKQHVARNGLSPLNGRTLTHLSLILAMQVCRCGSWAQVVLATAACDRKLTSSSLESKQSDHESLNSSSSSMQMHGWPYVLVLEDDAEPLPMWHMLFRGILAAINARDGDVGLVNFAPLHLQGALAPAANMLLFRLATEHGAFQAAQSVLYGRRMIRAVQTLLSTELTNRAGSAVHVDQAFGVEHIGIGPPNLLVAAHVMTMQRVLPTDVANGKLEDYKTLFYNSERKLRIATSWWHRQPAEVLAGVNASTLP